MFQQVYHDFLFPDLSDARFSNPSSVPHTATNVQLENSLLIVSSGHLVKKTSLTGRKLVRCASNRII
ncbi:unnamed protein product [Hymenolepis diminuta]|uniref:Uncharacterized protein n=1 Tax=Hymenolepis diminuta TaxID=6216 RepID=A0A564YAQ6_HYMDI|nr:unnamed protein product [Hymenolepis diminuta]